MHLDTRSASVYVQTNVSAPAPAGSGRQRLIVGLVGIAIFAAAAWLALIVVSRIDDLFLPGQGISGIPALPGVEQNSENGQVNILVLGLDRRPYEGNIATRTDTIFILMVDGASKSARILGIPRDTWVDIPLRDGNGTTQGRINTVFERGEAQDYDGGGPALIKRVVEDTTGIPIDRYVMIDFQGFVKLIDELGGIDVYVPKKIYDPTFSRTELPGDYTPLSFDVGEYHMDGQTALDYSRTRYGNSDLDRIQRQQQVIFAAIDKALALNFARLDKLTSLWGKYKDTIDTDINDVQAPGYAALAAKIDPDRITALSLASATVPYTTPAGEAVLLIDKDIVKEIVGALLTDTELANEDAHIEVRSPYGLTTELIDYLAQAGFAANSISATTVDDTPLNPLTEIIDFTGKSHTVDRIAELLQVNADQIRTGDDSDRELLTKDNTDILILMGADILGLDFAKEAQQNLTGQGN